MPRNLDLDTTTSHLGRMLLEDSDVSDLLTPLPEPEVQPSEEETMQLFRDLNDSCSRG